MQPTDYHTIARRALDVEDYIDILRRHKGWIFGPFLFCVVASVVGVYLWPDSYVSQEEAARSPPSRFPRAWCNPPSIRQMYDRITSMEQEILSRSVLTNIIRNWNLYPREISRMPVEDVIELMKRNISHHACFQRGKQRWPQPPPFRPSPSSSPIPTSILAQKVVADLGARFIDENIRPTAPIAPFRPRQFMKDEMDQAKEGIGRDRGPAHRVPH